MKIRGETKFNRKLSKIFIFPGILPICSSDTFLKTYFKKVVFECNYSPSATLEITSSDDIGQKQSAAVEFLILVEELLINMYNRRLQTRPSPSLSHIIFIPKKVALSNTNYFLKQRKCNLRQKKS